MSEKQLKINEINQTALNNNCIWVEQTYSTMRDKLTWKCQKGHTWKRKYDNQKLMKEWCKDCNADKKEQQLLVKINDFAKTNNGRCLSLSCKNIDDKVELQCQNNHSWQVAARSIIYQKSWCKICAGTELLNIEIAKDIARQRAGECLSNVYVGANEKLLWRCYFGHTWTATLNSTRNLHSWCPSCNIYVGEEITRQLFEILFAEKFKKIRLSIMDDMELDGYCEKLNLAFEYDGNIHYKFMKHIHKTENRFKEIQNRDILKTDLCKKNNITLIRVPYYTKYDDIQQFIIDECQKNEIVVTYTNKIDYTTFTDIYKLNETKYNDLKNIIESKNGTILTSSYISNNEPFEVRCSNQHIWKTCGKNIKDGYWCPVCAKKQKHTIEEMQELAKIKGGRCLSNSYFNNNTKLQWECKNNHIWEAVPKSIIRGVWCNDCFLKR